MKKLRGIKRQKEVADDLQITAAALSHYERGIRTPRDALKTKIANYYGVTVQDLFYPEQNKKDIQS